MSDYKSCEIRAPHEGHNWISVAPKTINYHYCDGRQWTNDEVYNHLQGVIRSVLFSTKNQANKFAGMDDIIMGEIWPQVVGFLQPEDMPATVTLGGINVSNQGYQITPGRMMEIPPSPIDRIADAVEKIAKLTDHMDFCGHGNIEVFCGPCNRKG